MENYQNNIFENNTAITESAKAYLLETAKWAKFLSILGIICYSFLVIVALFMILGGASSGLGSIMDNTGLYEGIGVTAIGFIYLIISLIFIYPTYCLYKFSVKIKHGLNSNNNEEITEAFKNHKTVYKFYGIFVIILLSFYVLAIIIGILALTRNI